MKMLTTARLVGSLFLLFGLGMLGFMLEALRAIGLFSPMSFVIGTWLVCIGAYQIATNVTSTTPANEIPKWWVPGLAAVSLVSLGGPLVLVVYGSY